MKHQRLMPLLAFSHRHEQPAIGAPKHQWIFRPSGPWRTRLFFLWIDEHGHLRGTRCRDEPSDPLEPWQWHAYLPQLFLRTMLSMLPPEEIAAATAARVTGDFLVTELSDE